MAQHFADVSIRGSYADFFIQDVDLAIVNSMRRAIVAEVPTAAFCFTSEADTNTVTIRANTSVLHNEFLGHRLSLIPIHLNEEETAAVAQGTAQYEFQLQVTNTGTTVRDVTTADFQGSLNGAPLSAETLARFFPTDPLTQDPILIVRLKPHQASSDDTETPAELVDVTCTLRMGSGKQHARWCPTSLCTFGNQVDDARAESMLQEQLDKARAANATQAEIDRVVHDFKCMGRQRCFRVNAHGDPSVFRFQLRSECGLRPSYIVFKSLATLAQRVKDLAANIRAAVPPHPTDIVPVTIEPHGQVPGMFMFDVANEDHTLGNLVQSLLFNKFIRDQASDDLEYIGYHHPHPLENRIIMRVKVTPKVADVQAFVAQALQDVVVQRLHDLMAEWTSASGLDAYGIREVADMTSGRVTGPVTPSAAGARVAPSEAGAPVAPSEAGAPVAPEVGPVAPEVGPAAGAHVAPDGGPAPRKRKPRVAKQ